MLVGAIKVESGELTLHLMYCLIYVDQSEMVVDGLKTTNFNAHAS